MSVWKTIKVFEVTIAAFVGKGNGWCDNYDSIHVEAEDAQGAITFAYKILDAKYPDEKFRVEEVTMLSWKTYCSI